MNKIPKELQPFVKINEKNKLTHTEEMPSELKTLFIKTKAELEKPKPPRKKQSKWDWADRK